MQKVKLLLGICLIFAGLSIPAAEITLDAAEQGFDYAQLVTTVTDAENGSTVTLLNNDKNPAELAQVFDGKGLIKDIIIQDVKNDLSIALDVSARYIALENSGTDTVWFFSLNYITKKFTPALVSAEIAMGFSDSDLKSGLLEPTIPAEAGYALTQRQIKLDMVPDAEFLYAKISPKDPSATISIDWQHSNGYYSIENCKAGETVKIPVSALKGFYGDWDNFRVIVTSGVRTGNYIIKKPFIEEQKKLDRSAYLGTYADAQGRKVIFGYDTAAADFTALFDAEYKSNSTDKPTPGTMEKPQFFLNTQGDFLYSTIQAGYTANIHMTPDSTFSTLTVTQDVLYRGVANTDKIETLLAKGTVFTLEKGAIPNKDGVLFVSTDGTGCGRTAEEPYAFSDFTTAINAAGLKTVQFAAGKYEQSIKVTKPISLRGAQAGVDGRTRSLDSMIGETLFTQPMTIQFSGSADGISVDGLFFNYDFELLGADKIMLNIKNDISVANCVFRNEPVIWTKQRRQKAIVGGAIVALNIEKNLFHGFESALFLYGATSEKTHQITNNTIINTKYGMRCDGSKLNVQNNFISAVTPIDLRHSNSSNSSSDMTGTGGTLTAENNIFEIDQKLQAPDGGESVIRLMPKSTVFKFANNTFLNVRTYGKLILAYSEYDFSNNYWGAETPNFSTRLGAGKFVTSPYYTDSTLSADKTASNTATWTLPAVYTKDIAKVSVVGSNGTMTVSIADDSKDSVLINADKTLSFLKAGKVTLIGTPDWGDAELFHSFTVADYVPENPLVKNETIVLSDTGTGDGTDGNPARNSQIADALKNANEVIIESGSVTLGTPIAVEEGKKLTGNGNTIYGGLIIGGKSSAPSGLNKAPAPIADPVETVVSGLIIDGSGITQAYPGVILQEGAVLSACTVQNWTSGGALMFGGRIENSKIQNNTSKSDGAGVNLIIGKLIGSTVKNNTCDLSKKLSGGGVYAWSDGSALIENCTISGNQARNCGGLHIFGTTLLNSQITGNKAVKIDEAVSDGEVYTGGIHINDGSRVDGCTITGNTADYGPSGAAFGSRLLTKYPDLKGAILSNSLIADNIGVTAGAAVQFQGDSQQVVNCTVVNNKGGKGFNTSGNIGGYRGIEIINTLSFGNTDADFLTADKVSVKLNRFAFDKPFAVNALLSGDSVQITDPKFINATQKDYRLNYGSALIDAGVSVVADSDLTGASRAVGTYTRAAKTDIGAYECQTAFVIPVPENNNGVLTVYVDSAAIGNGNGNTPANAYNGTNLQLLMNDLGLNPVGESVNVRLTAGTYNGGFTMVEGVNVIGSGIGKTIMDGQENARVLFQPADFSRETVWSDLTIQNGVSTPWMDPFDSESEIYNGGGAILFGNGTLKNVLFTKNKTLADEGSSFGGALYMYGGKLLNSTVSENFSIFSPLSVEAGLVENCIIENNTFNGCGAVICCGTMRNSIIRNNKEIRHNGAGVGGLYMGDVSGGLVENCVISGNEADCVTILIQAGNTLRNCLIFGNISKTGPILNCNYGGTVENCTITANTVTAPKGAVVEYYGSNKAYPEGGQDWSAGTLTNCLIAGNNAETQLKIKDPGAGNQLIGFPTYCAVQGETIVGEGNLNVADAMFVNAADSDFRLLANSPAVDAGTAGTSSDINGNVRVGTHFRTPKTDIGAYECQTAFVIPVPEDNNGVLTVYVDSPATGNGSSTGNAYNGANLQDLLNDLGTNVPGATVKLSAGTYAGGFTMVEGINVTGAGMGKTILDGQNTYRVLAQPDTFLIETVWSHMTLAHGVADATNLFQCTATGTQKWNIGGGAILQPGGKLDTVEITQNRADEKLSPHGPAGLFMFGGEAFNSVISDNESYAVSALNMIGGTVDSCIIENNRSSLYGVILVEKGTLKNSIIRKNIAQTYEGPVIGAATYLLSAKGGLGAKGALIEKCIITENTANAYDAVLVTEGSTMTGCLITRNTAAGSGLKASANATVISTTIVDNIVGKRNGVGAFSVSYYPAYDKYLVATNCLSANNVTSSGESSNYGTGGTPNVTYCAIEGVDVAGEGNINLVDSGLTTDYRLLATSPCIDAGTNGAYTAADSDLAGNSRIIAVNPGLVQPTIDIGAYEFNGSVTDLVITATPKAQAPSYSYGTVPTVADVMDLSAAFNGHPVASATYTVTFIAKDGTEYPASATLPVGTYGAKVTVNAPYTGSLDLSATEFFSITAVSPEITSFNATAISYGQTLSASIPTGTAAFNGEAVEGGFAWQDPTAIPLPGATVTVTFTPASANYSATSATIELVVTPVKPVLSLTQGNAIASLKKGATADYTVQAVSPITQAPVSLALAAVPQNSAVVTAAVKGNAITLTAVETGETNVVITATSTNCYLAPEFLTLTVRVTIRGEVIIQLNDQQTVYSAVPQKGIYSVKLDGAFLSESQYTVSYTGTNGSAVAAPVNADTYTLTITADQAGQFFGTQSARFVIAPFVIAADSLIVTDTAFVYDTLAHAVTVSVDSTILPGKLPLSGNDLAVTYDGQSEAPTAAGTYAVSVKAVGNFVSEVKDAQMSISSFVVPVGAVTIGNLNQTNTAVTPITVRVDSESYPILKDALYTVTYNGLSALPTTAGTYIAAVTFDGNFSGIFSAQLVVTAPPVPPAPKPEFPKSVVDEVTVPGTVVEVTDDQIGLPTTNSKPKAIATYHKPFARPGAWKSKLNVAVKMEGDTVRLTIKTPVILFNQLVYKIEKKSRFTQNILADTGFQLDSLPIQVAFSTKAGPADSTITLIMAPPTLYADSFKVLTDPTSKRFTRYFVVKGKNFGTKHKMWIEFDNGKKMVRKGLSIVRKNITLVDDAGTSYTFSKNEEGTLLLKFNRYYDDPNIDRLDFVMDNRNGMDAFTPSER